MSLLSFPKQRSSSSHVQVVDEAWEKLEEYRNYMQEVILTLNILLVHRQYDLSTPADDKLSLHHLSRSCRHTLFPIVHCNRPPVCQRSLLPGQSCLPASDLHLIVLEIRRNKNSKGWQAVRDKKTNHALLTINIIYYRLQQSACMNS